MKVEARIGRTTWSTSIFPDKTSGSYVLPLKTSVRTAERVSEGDTVRFRLIIAP